MEHVFITSADVTSPRWQQAFATARSFYLPVNNTPLPLDKFPPSTLVWLLVDGPDGNNSLTDCLALGIKVVAMTREENADQAKRVISAGASGYVHYLAVPALLQQIAQVVGAGGVWIGAELMRKMLILAAPPQQSIPHIKMQLLTPREQAVAEAVAVGKTNKEVARSLDITERTVKAHLGAIFEKLGVRDRLQLVLAVTKS
jgi:DNA-binding NarL/FixJ family response regulator